MGFITRREQVISLYTRHVGGKQPFIRVVSLHHPFSLNAVSFMEASAFECLVRYFLTAFSPMSTMKADGCKRGRQSMSSPQSVGLFLTVSISYFLPHRQQWHVQDRYGRQQAVSRPSSTIGACSHFFSFTDHND